MKTYKVYTQEHRLFLNKVKAKNYQEAVDKVDKSENSFHECSDCNWENTKVEELDQKGNVVKTWDI
jgi:hypothetical protein